MYRLTNTEIILRLEDGTYIPPDPGNLDFVAYLAWLDEGNTPEPATIFVPQTVSRYQGREAMRRTSYGEGTLFEAVEALIAAPETPALYKDAWAEIQTFERDSPMLNTLAGLLGLSQEDLDNLFILAGSIKV